jgi:hypothetical protein
MPAAALDDPARAKQYDINKENKGGPLVLAVVRLSAKEVPALLLTLKALAAASFCTATLFANGSRCRTP